MKLGSVNGEVPQRVEGMGGECDRNILYTCMKVSKNKLKYILKQNKTELSLLWVQLLFKRIVALDFNSNLWNMALKKKATPFVETCNVFIAFVSVDCWP